MSALSICLVRGVGRNVFAGAGLRPAIAGAVAGSAPEVGVGIEWTSGLRSRNMVRSCPTTFGCVNSRIEAGRLIESVLLVYTSILYNQTFSLEY